MPADRITLGAWLADRAAKGKGASARRSLSAVRAAHLELGYEDPAADAWLQRVAAGAERGAAATRPARPLRAPLPLSVVSSLLKNVPEWIGVTGGLAAWRTVPDPVLLALRDAAMVALGFRLMRRPAETAALRVDDLADRPDGGIDVLVRRSKTDQLGVGQQSPIEPAGGLSCPVALLHRWLAVRRIFADRGSGERTVFVTVTGRPLSTSAFSSVVARAAAGAGLVGHFSGHSLRIGGATAAVHGGASMAQVKAVGGWSSDAVRRYVRPTMGDLSSRMGFG